MTVFNAFTIGPSLKPKPVLPAQTDQAITMPLPQRSCIALTLHFSAD
jgi:hypothetical protein